MSKVSPTLEALNELRSEVRDIRTELGESKVRLEHLEHETREGFVRVTTELVSMHETLRDVRDALVQRRVDHARLDDHEHRLGALEKKVG